MFVVHCVIHERTHYALYGAAAYRPPDCNYTYDVVLIKAAGTGLDQSVINQACL